MRRREFIGLLGAAAMPRADTLLGGTMSAWPLMARAQQPPKVPTIGFLGAATPSGWSQWVTVFVQRLRDLGWVEGRKHCNRNALGGRAH